LPRRRCSSATRASSAALAATSLALAFRSWSISIAWTTTVASRSRSGEESAASWTTSSQPACPWAGFTATPVTGLSSSPLLPSTTTLNRGPAPGHVWPDRGLVASALCTGRAAATAQDARVPTPRRYPTATTACCRLSRAPAANTWPNRSAPTPRGPGPPARPPPAAASANLSCHVSPGQALIAKLQDLLGGGGIGGAATHGDHGPGSCWLTVLQ
jgi:hypothetical protein